MARKSKAACALEYAALRAACAFVNAVPYSAACAAARFAARIACGPLRYQRKRTLARILAAFPGLTEEEALRIARLSLENVFQTAVEMIRAPRLTKRWLEEHVEDAALYAERLKEIVSAGRGAVIMVPHCGNWYMAAWTMARFGIPLVAVAARQRNPLIDAWLGRQYGEDTKILARGSAAAMRNVLAMIRGGRAFAILPDLRSPRRDTEVPFLNGIANVSRGGAMFAVSAGAPVVVAVMRRTGGRHQFDHLATIEPDPSAPDRREEARRITREAMRLIDEAVRKTPEQWFWYNKRWILQPVD